MESVAIPDPPEEATTTWRYAYDTAGERVLAWRKGPTGRTAEARITLRDEGGAVLSDWLLTPNHDDPGLSYFGRARDYLYAGGRMVAQVDWGAAPIRRFAAADHLGSTRYLLSENPSNGTWAGEVLEFYPFGATEEGSADPDTTHLFTGHERDLGDYSSELDYMHARYYSPNLGRFVSVDPVGGLVGSSQSWNRYSYVMNNPIRLIDLDGLQAVDPVNRGMVEPLQFSLNTLIKRGVVTTQQLQTSNVKIKGTKYGASAGGNTQFGAGHDVAYPFDRISAGVIVQDGGNEMKANIGFPYESTPGSVKRRASYTNQRAGLALAVSILSGMNSGMSANKAERLALLNLAANLDNLGGVVTGNLVEAIGDRFAAVLSDSGLPQSRQDALAKKMESLLPDSDQLPWVDRPATNAD